MIQRVLVDFFYLALVRPTYDTYSPKTVRAQEVQNEDARKEDMHHACVWSSDDSSGKQSERR